MIVLAVIIGGALGAPARFFADRAITARVAERLPWGTFTINISGSLVLGFLTGLEFHGHLSPFDKALLGTGFCGAYTTFSTWSFETVRLIERRDYTGAVSNALGSVLVGFGAAAAGFALGLLA
jgi:CrcB protein